MIWVDIKLNVPYNEEALKVSFFNAMNSFDKTIKRIENYDIESNSFQYNDLLSHEENRGYFLARILQQFIGDYVEMRIPEYDPDENSEHLGVGKKVDYKNSIYCFEHKESPSTDNSSSRKANLQKLKEYADDHNLIPVYAYTESRSKKNDYMKDGIRHVHGKSIFTLLNIEDKWDYFVNDIENIKVIIVNKLREKFDEYYKNFIV